MTPGAGTRAGLRGLLLLTVGLVLLAIVLLTAGGADVSSGAARVAVPQSAGSLLFATFTALLVISAALGVLIVYILRPVRRGKDDDAEWASTRRPPTWLERVLAVVAPVVLMAAAVAFIVFLAHRAGAGSGVHMLAAPSSGTAVAPPGGAQAPPPPADQTAWGLIGLAAGGAVVAAVAVTVLVLGRRAKRDGADTASGDDEAALDAVVRRAAGLSLDDVRRERDPRRAILAAYARMEGLFAAEGLARPSSQTPSEYLAGVLLASSAPRSALLDLTLLFEEARFSSHEMSARDRDDAISALVSIGEALA